MWVVTGRQYLLPEQIIKKGQECTQQRRSPPPLLSLSPPLQVVKSNKPDLVEVEPVVSIKVFKPLPLLC